MRMPAKVKKAIVKLARVRDDIKDLKEQEKELVEQLRDDLPEDEEVVVHRTRGYKDITALLITGENLKFKPAAELYKDLTSAEKRLFPKVVKVNVSLVNKLSKKHRNSFIDKHGTYVPATSKVVVKEVE